MKTINQKIALILSKVFLIAVLFFTTTQISAQSDSSLGTLKQINAGLLNVGYTEAGPATEIQ